MNRFQLANKDLLVEETLLSTANGYIGIRANFEEGYCEKFDTIRGTYINGFYDNVDIEYGERAYGFPLQSERMLNVIDAQTIKISIDGDMFSLLEGEVLDLRRELNIWRGYVERYVEWKSPKGHHLKLRIKRMASFEQLELALIEYSITSINYSGEIEIISTVHGDVCNYSNDCDPRVASGDINLLCLSNISTHGTVTGLSAKTKKSKLQMSCAVTHDINLVPKTNHASVVFSGSIFINQGEAKSFAKYIAYTDCLRHEDFELLARKIVIKAKKKGCSYWFKSQQRYLKSFWEVSKISICGDKEVEDTINYNIFQLNASMGKKEFSSICAKGLSGEGYEGHCFWDAEVFIAPFFLLTQPQAVKRFIKYRYETITEARRNAEQLGHQKGIKIPWRTISGRECSPYFPAGSAQYHINADVAYLIIQYYLVTGDTDLIFDYGFEIIFETARLWLEVGHFRHDGKFCICNVTGPDEYTAIVNNNYYTNALAKYHLEWAEKFNSTLRELDCARYQKIKTDLKILDDEITLMKKASGKMYLPYSKDLNINLQDDSFINKPKWDFQRTPKNHYPLLLHYHPLTIYRHQVLKQADTVLAHLLLDNESEEVMKASYEYYENLTTHDSSLSPCAYSIMAARIGIHKKAYDYFMQTLRLDLDNLHSNTKDGLHMANAGGAYMTLVYGFAGLRIKEDGLYLRPTKPKQWKSYNFNIMYKDVLINVIVGNSISITVESPVTLCVYDQKYEINNTCKIRLLA